MLKHTSLLFSAYIVVVVTLVGCSVTERPNQPSFSSTEGDVVISSAQNIVAASSPLSSFLLDKNLDPSDIADITTIPAEPDHVLLLFESGELVKTDVNGNARMMINANGRGPGELLFPLKIKVRNGTLYVLDRRQSKISLFT